MRGLVPEVRTRLSVGATLPAMLQEDPFLQRFTAGLDEVLAPFAATLDSLDRYVDPAVTPEDFLGWLAGWVGLDLDPRWPVDVRRSLLRSVAGVQDARGTTAGLRDEIALLTGCDVEVCDPGGVACSPEPGGSLPAHSGTAPAGTVVVRGPGAPADQRGTDSDARARLVRAGRAAGPAPQPLTGAVPT